MKDRVFINLRGNIRDYAPRLKRQQKTRSTELQGLHHRLNDVIERYGEFRATAENCSLFWSELEKEFKRVKITPTDDVQRKALDELIEGVRSIGKEIAYFTFRNGADTNYLDYLQEWWRLMHKGDTALASTFYQKYILAFLSLKGCKDDITNWEGVDWEAQSEQAFLTRGTVNEACEYYFGAKVD